MPGWCAAHHKIPWSEGGRTDLEGGALQACVVALTGPLREAEVDHVVLGCTHYPFVEDASYTVFAPPVEVEPETQGSNPTIVAETKVDIPEASVSDAVMLLDLRSPLGDVGRDAAIVGTYSGRVLRAIRTKTNS